MKVKLSRYTECDKTKLKYWEKLISALVLCGYQVHEIDDQIIFETGGEDEVE